MEHFKTIFKDEFSDSKAWILFLCHHVISLGIITSERRDGVEDGDTQRRSQVDDSSTSINQPVSYSYFSSSPGDITFILKKPLEIVAGIRY